MSQGKTFGKYVVTKLLRKQGDYVSIFLSTMKDGDKPFELHVLKHAVNERSPDFQRFLNEFQTLAGLEHPNIVKVTDMGMVDNKAYYATPHSGAKPLSELIGGGKKFTIEETVNVGLQVAEAMIYLHGKKVLHRDIGPDSVYYHDAFKRAIISGFALVKNFRLTNLTARGLMTPTEMRVTPEQVEDLPYSERTDIYLLGDLLYWMLTERTALTLDFSPEKPSVHNSEIPAALDKTIMRMLKKEPDSRIQTAQEVAKSLKASLAPPEED